LCSKAAAIGLYATTNTTIPHTTVEDFSHLMSRFSLHFITVWVKGRSWFVVTVGQYLKINLTGRLYKFSDSVKSFLFYNPKSCVNIASVVQIQF